jgi:hypothetical protein
MVMVADDAADDAATALEGSQGRAGDGRLRIFGVFQAPGACSWLTSWGPKGTTVRTLEQLIKAVASCPLSRAPTVSVRILPYSLRPSTVIES